MTWAIQEVPDVTDRIVEPLAAIDPLLGVIAVIAIVIVGFLAIQLRQVTIRLRDVQDREITGLRDFLGVLKSVEGFVQAAQRDSEKEHEFRAHCRAAIETLSEEQKEILRIIRERSHS